MMSLRPERSATATRKAFLRHIRFYGLRGIRIAALLSDNEQGITSLGLQFGGAKIVLTQIGPDMHIPQVERSIRAVKEGTSGILHTLPYNCPLALFAHPPEFVAARMSIFKSSTRPSDITAFQILHGRPFNAKIDDHLEFGTYCQFSDTKMCNSMEARTLGSIAQWNWDL